MVSGPLGVCSFIVLLELYVEFPLPTVYHKTIQHRTPAMQILIIRLQLLVDYPQFLVLQDNLQDMLRTALILENISAENITHEG